MRRLLYRGLNSTVWEGRLIERGWPAEWAAAFALFLTSEGPLPGAPVDGDAELDRVTQQRDEAWAKIDQLIGRTP